MGKKEKAPASPDYTPILEALGEQSAVFSQLQAEQFEWAQTAYNGNKEIADLSIEKFLEVAETNLTNAGVDRERFQSVFQPLEDSLVQEAQDYDSESRRNKEAGAAQAGVAQQFDAARQSALRGLESFGINPAATRYAALDIGVRTQEAAAKAAAGNVAINRVEDKADALRSEAIALGQRYPGQIQNSLNAAVPAAAGAVDAGNATSKTGAAILGTATQYGALATNALTAQGAVTNTAYGNESNAYEQEQNSSSGIGGLIGTAAGIGASIYAPGTGGIVKSGVTAGLSGLAEGGAIPAAASPSGGAIPDDVPIAISAGEFVVPRDVVEWKGQEFMQKLIAQSRKAVQEGAAQPAIGGPAQGGAPAAIPVG